MVEYWRREWAENRMVSFWLNSVDSTVIWGRFLISLKIQCWNGLCRFVPQIVLFHISTLFSSPHISTSLEFLLQPPRFPRFKSQPSFIQAQSLILPTFQYFQFNLILHRLFLISTTSHFIILTPNAISNYSSTIFSKLHFYFVSISFSRNQFSILTRTFSYFPQTPLNSQDLLLLSKLPTQPLHFSSQPTWLNPNLPKNNDLKKLRHSNSTTTPLSKKQSNEVETLVSRFFPANGLMMGQFSLAVGVDLKDVMSVLQLSPVV